MRARQPAPARKKKGVSSSKGRKKKSLEATVLEKTEIHCKGEMNGRLRSLSTGVSLFARRKKSLFIVLCSIAALLFLALVSLSLSLSLSLCLFFFACDGF